MYFNTIEEMNAYYPNGVPSTVLAIVQPDADTPAVLFTSSNNSPVGGGKNESQGGYIPSPEDEEKITDYDDALQLSEYTLEGEDEEEETNENENE